MLDQHALIPILMMEIDDDELRATGNDKLARLGAPFGSVIGHARRSFFSYPVCTSRMFSGG